MDLGHLTKRIENDYGVKPENFLFDLWSEEEKIFNKYDLFTANKRYQYQALARVINKYKGGV